MEIDTLSVILLILIIFFTYLSIRNVPNPDVHPLLLSSQSDATKVRYPGESAIYRNVNTPHGFPQLLSKPESDIKTIKDLFDSGLKRGDGGVKKCLKSGQRSEGGKYVWQTYEQIAERVTNFGSGLIKFMELTPKTDNLFGIFMNNRPEWVIADLASSYYSLVTVAIPHIPLFLSDVINQIQFTKIRGCIVAEEALPIILSAASSCSGLKYLIIAGKGEVSEEYHERINSLGLIVSTFEEIEEIGKRSRIEHVIAASEDTATIVFSSDPSSKQSYGIELTHGNIVADVAGFLASIPNQQIFTSEDIHLSYLSLAHIFERITLAALLFSGSAIVFYSGLLSNVLSDAEDVKPTIFVSEPEFLSKFHETMLNTFGKGILFKQGYNSKHQSLRMKGQLIKNSLWDRLTFNKVKDKLGGRVRIIFIKSGPPISQSTLDFLRITIGCQVIQVYVSTQCSGIVTSNAFCDYQLRKATDNDDEESHCGGPLRCNEIKLIDCVDKGFTVEDIPNPRGEICVRGPNVMKGYYKQPSKTSQVIDSNGWLHTGDIGMILPNGTLKIIY
ncbi:hypothetical protein Glove_853g5 [Diversispora epigaea]|uniref:AMP-dependent synthetase/ligase domain-containing protein n=1 Tax=Diversispora epigaea TaxID=1348612 RepID=A0A397FZ49_9GLOM|nr:hypothetical protein Glove_853g5 [Diversispora epigaea]